MGMLFGNYNKPGPGVRKDAPAQKAVPRFFSIFTRKFFDLVKLNLLFCIPVVAVAALVFALNMVIRNLLVDFIPVILLFPFIGGLTYVTRNYAREEHAFILWDFKDAVKNNWKAFLIDGVLVYVVSMVLSVSIPYYISTSHQNFFMSFAAGICILIAVLFLFSQYYVPVMIVTFDLKIGQILKNSFIFSIVGLWRNLLLTVMLGILAFLIFIAFNFSVPLMVVVIVLFLFVLLLFSFCSLLINFTVYPLVDKMMIQPYLKNQNNNDGEDHQKKGASSDFVDRT